MRLILAPKPMEEIDEKLLKSWDWKSGLQGATLQHMIGDDLTQAHTYIDANQEFTKCGNIHNILPLFGGLEGSHTFSPLLHHEAHPHLSKSNYG
jgi:hypothetical protein